MFRSAVGSTVGNGFGRMLGKAYTFLRKSISENLREPSSEDPRLLCHQSFLEKLSCSLPVGEALVVFSVEEESSTFQELPSMVRPSPMRWLVPS